MNPLIINFTPTGIVPRKANGICVPESANEIIEQVHQAYELGITIVHLHARNHSGEPTYKSTTYARMVEGIKKHCPALVVCTSLSGRNFTEFEQRSQPLEVYPDMASLTLSSLNFSTQASNNSPDMICRLVDKMNQYGVKPELEVFDAGMINYSKYLIEKGVINAPFYYNIILGNIASAQMDLAQLGIMLKDLPHNSYCALGGIGKFQLSANVTAIANNMGVRVGLEDNTIFDYKTGEKATNIQLLKRVHNIAQLTQREIMKPNEFGELGFYNKNRTNV